MYKRLFFSSLLLCCLLPLAYGRGDGLADILWLSAVSALRRPYMQADLDDLLASPVAAFLTTAINSNDGRRYRLFHQALAEALTRN
ncbi:MAG: hypothetical protein KY428_12490, partial [Bacteroidetes bacterium]|nr:hypothetical protein [Bacteroidota bacterium]